MIPSSQRSATYRAKQAARVKAMREALVEVHYIMGRSADIMEHSLGRKQEGERLRRGSEIARKALAPQGEK